MDNERNDRLPDELTEGPRTPAAAVPDGSGAYYEILQRYFPTFGEAGETPDLSGVAEILATASIDDTKTFDAPPCALYVNGVRAATLQDISVVTGPAKVRKTLWGVAVANSLLGGRPTGGDGTAVFTSDLESPRVLYVDTEQSDYHAKRTYDRITNGIPAAVVRDRLNFYALREYSYAQRLLSVCVAIDRMRPQFVVIDGLADLMQNTNDVTESAAVVGVIMAMAKTYGCHILSVLHTTNSNAQKGRGHAGSEAERKAETVYLVDVDHTDTAFSVVKGQYTRNESFSNIRLTHDGERGYICEVVAPLTEEGKKNRFRLLFLAVKSTLAGEESGDAFPTARIVGALRTVLDNDRDYARTFDGSPKTLERLVKKAAGEGLLKEAAAPEGMKRSATYYTFDELGELREMLGKGARRAE